MNPELQPEANLSSLPAEANLTKDELNKFQRLSPQKQQEQKQERLAKLLKLQNKLEQAVNEATKTGNLEEAKKLKEETEKEIRNLERVVDTMELVDLLKPKYQLFLEKIFGKPKGEFVPILVRPEDQNYATLKDDIDADKFGEYTLNPDTQNMDFQKIPESKIFIPDIPSTFVGKSPFEVFKYLVDTYSDTHYIPGVEYWKWLIENPTKTLFVFMEISFRFYFPGSLFRYSDVRWHVPCMQWNGSVWNCHEGWIKHEWSPTDHVVLIEK
jgi:hypothetical protein